MSNKLLPCPFCGGEARSISRLVYKHGKAYSPETSDRKYYVQCNLCHSQRGACEYDTDHEAIAAWNNRACKWIPINEPIPQSDESVFVTDGYNVAIAHRCEELETGWYAVGFVKRATHWMPLPALPKEAANESK